MEPTSSPDNAQPSRGLARFWPVHRDAEDEQNAAETPELAATRSSETEMVALGSRRGAEAISDPAFGTAEFGPVFGAPAGQGGLSPADHGQRPTLSPFASANRGPDGPQSPGEPPRGLPSPGSSASGPSPSGPSSSGLPSPGLPSSGLPSSGLPSSGLPSSAGGSPRAGAEPAGQHEAPERDAAPSGDGAAPAGEPSRNSPWDRDAGTFGGFGLGGRNGRFLFGGRNPAEPRPAVNGHGVAELNGRSSQPDAADGPTLDEPGRAAGGAAHSEEEGRAGVPGFPAAGASGPAEDGTTPDTPGAGRRRDPADAPATEPRRQATGWASVPTSTTPILGPTSAAPAAGAPTSGAPAPGMPTSGAPAPGMPASGAPAPGLPTSGIPAAPARGAADPSPSYGQPPAYVPGLPDPTAGPVSGVPTPRTASIPVPAPVPPGRAARNQADAPAGDGAEETRPASGPGQVSITFGTEPPATASAPPPVPAPEAPATERRRFREDDGSPRTPSPRRSASLEDAEPARRGRRAAPDDEQGEEGPLRPGDVAAGQIAFWDDDATRHFRAAWHEVKAEFVDDPVTALTRAHDLLTDAVNELTEALLAERDELDPLRGSGTPDTESMRMAMRGYREFLDRILAL